MLVPTREAAGLRLRVLGFPVTVEWGFPVVMALLGLALGDPVLILAWLAIVTVSVLLHELGHAVAFRAYGVGSRIALHPFGGVTVPDGPVDGRGRRIVVSLAGPLSGLVLLGGPALVVLRGAEAGTGAADLAWLVVWVNVGWSLLNLVPVLPLDGGHVAQEVLSALSPTRGEAAGRALSIAVATGLAVLAFVNGLLLAALLAAWLAADSFRWFGTHREESALDVLRDAARALAGGRPGEARSLAMSVADGRAGRYGPVALELAAWAALTEGDDDGAARLVARLGPTTGGHLRSVLDGTEPAERLNLTVDAWLAGDMVPPVAYVERLDRLGLVDGLVDRVLGSRAEGIEAVRVTVVDLLVVAGRLDAATRLGEEALTLAPAAEPAYATARAHALAGRVDDALDRLGVALDLGWGDVTALDRDPALARLRRTTRFAALRARLPTS